MDSNYSLSDLKAVTDGDDNLFGGGNSSLLILLFLFMFMNGNNGFFGNNPRNECATTKDLNDSFNFAALERQNNETIAAVKENANTINIATRDVAMQNLSQIRDVQADIATLTAFTQNCCLVS